MSMVRGVLSIALVVLGSLVACTTFNDLQAEVVPNPDGKVANAQCTVNTDCQSLNCANGKCTAVVPGANPTDEKKDGDETDVDCGGQSAPKCADDKACKTATDCTSASCISNVCKAPSPTDGVKNADETDVDCGGSAAPKCATGKTCAINGDCAAGGCNYQQKCVQYPSCVGHEGGDTCGAGEDGEAGAQHESCCTTVTNGNGDQVAKYYATAGRMRAFITRYNGDLQTWAATNPPGWPSEWTTQLPASMDDALELLGPDGKRGCNVTTVGQGARTYWQPPLAEDASDKSDFDQKTLDEKMMNCVTWHLAQALCVFDGGRLANGDELEDLITNGNATTWPWEFQDKTAYDPNGQDPRVIHRYSYATPNLPADARKATDGSPLDHAFYIAPPGRRPTGADKYGAMDAVGGILPWANDDVDFFLFTESWEEHPKTFPVQSFTKNSPDGANAYYALGIRCVFPKGN